MPNVYAHASLGRQAVPQMSASHQKTIQAHPRAFALGLQGPDIFFNGSIFRDAEAGAFGSRLHRWSGRKVLESMLAPYAYQPLPAGVKAYLLGFLGHYRLDATAYPYVYAVQGDMVHHRALETDFDAFLLKREGHPAPWKSRLTKVLPADPTTQAIVVQAYAPWDDLPAEAICASTTDFRRIRRLLRTPNRPALWIVQGAMKAMRQYDAFYGMLMPPPSKAFPTGETWPDKPKDAMATLKKLHDDAIIRYLEDLAELEQRLQSQIPFSASFDLTFDGTPFASSHAPS